MRVSVADARPPDTVRYGFALGRASIRSCYFLLCGLGEEHHGAREGRPGTLLAIRGSWMQSGSIVLWRQTRWTPRWFWAMFCGSSFGAPCFPSMVLPIAFAWFQSNPVPTATRPASSSLSQRIARGNAHTSFLPANAWSTLNSSLRFWLMRSAPF